MEDEPIRGLDIVPSAETEPPSSPIPRRKKSVIEQNGQRVNASNRVLNSNGQRPNVDDTGAAATATKKRPASEAVDDERILAKRNKVEQNGASTPGDDLILVDDSGDGAIIIDDD